MRCTATLVLALILLAPATCRAQTFFETVDTGNSIDTAIVIPGGITQLQGSLNSDHDLWGFNLSSSQTVQISLGFSTFDDNLLLFDEIGRGIAGNDDIGRGSASPGVNLPAGISGLDSEISAFLGPGRYYIGVGRNNSFGAAADGSSFINNDSGLLASPTSEVLGFLDGVEGTGDYTLFFSPATAIPEPTSGFLVFGLLGAIGLKRRRN